MDGTVGIREIGNFLVEKPHQGTHQPTLGLTFLTQEQHVVASEQRQVDLGDDGVVVADDAGKQLLSRLEFSQEITLDFLFDGARRPAAAA